MTDRTELLSSKKRSSVAVVFSTYTKMRVNKSNFIVVVEGNDEPYYHEPFMRRISSTVFLRAHGKKNVLQLRDIILRHHDYRNSNKTVFIIDADFDDNANNIADDVYITPCYSVENFYFDDVLFRKVLSSEFHLCPYETPNEFEKVITWILDRKKEYLDIILEYNVFVKAHRAYERLNQGCHTLNLKNVNDTKIYSVSSAGITKVMTEVKEIFDYTEEISSDLLDEARLYFKSKDFGLFFRGKQHAYFIFKIFDILKKDRTHDLKIFESKSSVAINLSPDNILSIFSKYADIPQCLQAFINKFAGKLNIPLIDII